jgi:hypothetical protein
MHFDPDYDGTDNYGLMKSAFTECRKHPNWTASQALSTIRADALNNHSEPNQAFPMTAKSRL